MAKIYVGNLPFTATDADLRTLFSQHGTVDSVSLPVDRDTGRPRGFGFVEMSQADASRAIQSLNGQDMGEQLYGMGVMGWFMLVTIPTGLLALAAYAALLLVMWFVRRARRRTQSPVA